MIMIKFTVHPSSFGLFFILMHLIIAYLTELPKFTLDNNIHKSQSN